ncbi:MAG: nucleotidyltransferase domain-containing protein [Gorillibacterium sp.]|nr:nucleotidyltransferase domain-containing protein [Gorillibacterium sp.]
MNFLAEDQEQIIVDFLTKKYQVFAVILFGSAAKKKLRPDSDVDIAFMTETSSTAYDRFMSAQQLADKLGREVDLIDFREASSVFKVQILKHGKLLYDGNPFARKSAYMYALREYAMLNEERMSILENLGWKKGGDNEFGYFGKQDGDHPTLHSKNQ